MFFLHFRKSKHGKSFYIREKPRQFDFDVCQLLDRVEVLVIQTAAVLSLFYLQCIIKLVFGELLAQLAFKTKLKHCFTKLSRFKRSPTGTRPLPQVEI